MLSKKSLLLVCLLAAPHLALAKHYNVWFAGGQSNAVPEWADGIKQGLEASGAYDNVVVVNRKHGGAYMEEWWDNGPGANYTLDFFNEGTFPSWTTPADLEKGLDWADANGHTYTFHGLFWFQGEADSKYQSDRDVYETRFNAMLDHLSTTHFGGATLNWVAALIDADPTYYDPGATLPALEAGGRTMADIEAMRLVTQQMALNSPNGAVYDTRGYSRYDEWHLTATAAHDVGVAMAGVYVDNFAPVPLPGAFWLFATAITGMATVGRKR